MDANKREVLRDLPYHIELVCGLCKHGTFVAGSDWGTCAMVSYSHQKHTDTERQLSISRFGHCDRFSVSTPGIDGLGSFCEFLRG